MYGLHLTGVAGTGLLPAPAADAARPRVVIRHARQDPEPECMGTARAVLGLPAGRQLLLSRGEGTATFTGPRLSDDELVHPYLGAAASVFSRWGGREVFHAGAFVFGGLAWAVVGGREAGKSSLLAALAGLMLTGRIASVVSSQGQNMIFYVFAAAVIGGVNLNGGRGRLIGALTGVLLLGVLQNVLTLSQVPTFWIDAVYGAIILLALIFARLTGDRAEDM